MQTLLLVSFLLLGAVPVGAEELLIDSVYLEYEQCATSKATVNGNTNAYCTPEAVKKKQPWYVISINTHPDPCLLKMEAAMRAREEMDATHYEYLLLSMSREQARKTWDDTYDKTKKLWDDTKHECWEEKINDPGTQEGRR